jgi:TorA maturation chaperone TorD
MRRMRSATTRATPVTTVLPPSALFGLLASMYLCKPTAEAMTRWQELVPRAAPEVLGDLNEALERINLSSVQEMDDLLWEYTRLFIGPYRLPCPPWESVYTSSKKLLLQEASDAVRVAYDRLGLEVGDSNVFPDHVGAELNFMAILLEKVEAASGEEDRYRKLSKDFLDEHLRNWVPRFSLDMEKAANSFLYQSLARATRHVVQAGWGERRLKQGLKAQAGRPCKQQAFP